MSLSANMGTPSTGGHFGEKWVLGDMSDHWSAFQNKHKTELASCSTPSFSEGENLNRLQALDFTEAGMPRYK